MTTETVMTADDLTVAPNVADHYRFTATPEHHDAFLDVLAESMEGARLTAFGAEPSRFEAIVDVDY